MDEFQDQLSRLADLSDAELDALETGMVAAFDAADQSGDVEQMQALADGLDQVRSEKNNRSGGATTSAEAPAAAQAPQAPAPAVAASGAEAEGDPGKGAGEQPDGGDAEPDAEPETNGDVDVDDGSGSEADEPEAPAETPDETETETPDTDADDNEAEAETDPLMPSGDATTQKEGATMATSSDVPDANKPQAVAASAPPFTITAGGDIPSITAGSELADMDAVNEAMLKKVNSMRGVTGDGEYIVVASIRRADEIDDAQMLRTGDPQGNSRKIREFLKTSEYGTDAMVAAGWCAPKTPLYDIPGIGTTATPVSDSLPTFGVDRGGIIWQPPPGLGGIDTSSFGRWVNTADEGDPANFQFVPGATGTGTAADEKPCIDIPCGPETSTELGAVPLCLCFDVLHSRANPEEIRANTDLVMVAQARFLEQYLLAQLFSAPGVTNQEGTGNTIGTAGTVLGAARDILIQWRVVAAQFRWRNRLDPNSNLRVYAPAWLRDAMASDLTVQIPGDDALSVSFAELDGYVSDLNLSPVWYIDDIPTGVGTTATDADSDFGTYLGWPTIAEWLITTPGAYTRLDGGSLDLGVVRDRSDVQKNRYCQFAETFEGVAYMGPTDTADAWAVRGSTPIQVRGGFGPAVAAMTDVP